MEIRLTIRLRILFFIFCFSLCQLKFVYAFGLPEGEITVNVNLRQTPGLNGVIITGLKKNERVIIEDKQEDWYQVLVERKTYGVKGWVYSKYIKEDKLQEVLPVFAGADVQDDIKEKKLPEKVKITEPAAVEEKTDIEQKPPESEITIDDEVMMIFEKKEATYTKNLFEDNRLNITPENTGDSQDKAFIIKMLSKILSPLLACIAILFSHKALRMTKRLREELKRVDGQR